MSTPLTDAINALTTYANSVTGESDTTLSDAVYSLASGYGGSSGSIVSESGTYTAAESSIPTISFTGSHSTAPDIIVFTDVSSSDPVGNSITMFTYIDFTSVFGSAMEAKPSTSWATAYIYNRVAANLNNAAAAATYTRDEVTSSGFKPYAGSSTFQCISGRTYKWIALWI